ncbi:hypothetical protein JTB14_036938 [Gonioctena quinquepunctata]|nr:hypothetical protein JTB14_036938 [Gonioctena quinquepunctata]
MVSNSRKTASGNFWLPSEKIYQAEMLMKSRRDCWALKGMRIRVPEVVRSGDTVTLSCEYDLEQVALYSIKWYWNDEEFYRFVPKESPPFRAFAMANVNVDVSYVGRNSENISFGILNSEPKPSHSSGFTYKVGGSELTLNLGVSNGITDSVEFSFILNFHSIRITSRDGSHAI